MKLDDLEKYFSGEEIPKIFKLNHYTTITDTEKFISNYIQILRENSGNMNFMDHFLRLVELQRVWEEHKKSANQ